MKKTAVYMFIDALGWEIVNEYGFLTEELKNRYKIKMQFGYSSTAIPTILCGEKPAVHGHFSFFYYDPKNSPFKSFKYIKYCFGAGLHKHCILNRGRVRRWISKLFAKMQGYSGYFQLYSVPYDKLPYFDYCEKGNIFEKGGLAPVKNLRDVAQESGIDFLISDWHNTERHNVDEALHRIKADNLDFAFIYTAAFDSFMHDHVFDKNAVAERLKRYEAFGRELIEALEKSGRDYSFTIISDHGMTPTKGTQDLMKIVGDLGLKFGKDYAALFDSTMMRVWYLKDSARKIIRERLSKEDCLGAFVSPEDKVRYGINFPNDKFGNDIFLMDAGVQIEPCDLGVKAMAGMHGYTPEDKDSYAAFLSTAKPRFEPSELTDYFKLMKADIDELSKQNAPVSK